MEMTQKQKAQFELIKNGAVQILTEQSLFEKLQSGRTLTIKFGADPSRPDLHLGHSTVLRKFRIFQEMGHNIVFVIGDFTAMIGDPTGKSKTRPALTLEETRASGETYFRQITKILDPSKTNIVYNSEWLSKMNFTDILNLCSKYTLARILERDDFKNRFENNQPLSLHELMYPLIQGYDSVALKADIEVGGTDQTFNLLVGRTLQSDYGQTPQEVITYPLLIGLDGKEKMSKSMDNYIGIDEPADIMFEKCMKIPDNLLIEYFVLTTDMLKQDAEKIVDNDIREAHFIYASMIVTMYHSSHAAASAKERYLKVAGGTVPDSISEYFIDPDIFEISIIDLLKNVGFASSKSEARRQIQGRGIKINGVTAEDPMLILNESDFCKPLVLQLGKNKFISVSKS